MAIDQIVEEVVGNVKQLHCVVEPSENHSLHDTTRTQIPEEPKFLAILSA